MLNKKRDKLLLINIIIVIFELMGLFLTTDSHKFNVLFFYTADSNLLLFISSLILIYSILRDNNQSDWAVILRYNAVVGVSLTFIIVLTVLSWQVDFGLMRLLFYGSSLFLHTLCPILAVVSFVFLEKYDLGKKDILYACLFTVIYGIIILSLNVLKVIVGPYPFLMVYNQPVYVTVLWIIIIYIVVYIIAWTLKKLNERFNG